MPPGAPGAPTGAVDDFVGALAEAASSAAGTVDRACRLDLSVAGRGVELRVAGAALADILTPALAHAVGAPLPTDLRVDCWDGAETGVALPRSPWPASAFLPSGAIRGHDDDRYLVNYDRWKRMLVLLDRGDRRAYVHAHDAREVPAWVRRSPLRELFGWWAADHGMAMLHAGSVVGEHGAVALAGASGSGKSTTTLTCVAAGMGFMGDDACLVDFRPAPVANALFGFAKLEPDAFARLDAVRHLAVGDDPVQPLLDPASHLVPTAPLRAVLLVSVTGETRTRVEPAAPTDVLRELVTGSLDEGGATTLAGLRRVATEVPCLRVGLGTEPDGVVEAVAAAARGDR